MESTDQWVLVLNAVEDVKGTPEHFKLKQDFSKTLVEELLSQTADHYNLDCSALYLMCWGRVLYSEKSLESYGIKNGTLLILRQRAPSVEVKIPEIDDSYNENEPSRTILEKAFHYRKELKYLNKHSFPFARTLKTNDECRDKFIKPFPEIAKDPTLFAIFTEISTISALLDIKCLHSTLKRYPSFLAITQHFIELWKGEITKNPNANAELNNLFFLTDDEEDSEGLHQGSSSSGRSQQSNRSDLQNISRNLSSALHGNSSRRGNSGQSQPNGSQITPEMFRNALQSSMPSPTPECLPLPQTNDNDSSTASSSTSSLSRAPTLAEQLSRANSRPNTSDSSQQNVERSPQVQTLIDRLPQLQAMRELGITDEIVAIQALEAANGDLEVAVNIIYSDDN